MLILLTAFHTLDDFNRFPELSRTSCLFSGLSSPGKCHNKIPGLSRFSRTRTNPEFFWIISIEFSHSESSTQLFRKPREISTLFVLVWEVSRNFWSNGGVKNIPIPQLFAFQGVSRTLSSLPTFV